MLKDLTSQCSPSLKTTTVSMASSSDIPSSPTIWSSRPNVDTRLAKRLPKIICWCSIFPIRRNGKPVVPGCWQRGSNVSHRIIPIGKHRGRRLRISMGIGSYSRTRHGPCRVSDGYHRRRQCCQGMDAWGMAPPRQQRIRDYERITALPPSSPCTWQIGNQAFLIGNLLDVAWHLAHVYRKPIDHNHPRHGIVLHLTWAVPLRVHLPHH